MATPRRPIRPEPQFQVEDLVTPRRAKFLLWLNTQCSFPSSGWIARRRR